MQLVRVLVAVYFKRNLNLFRNFAPHKIIHSASHNVNLTFYQDSSSDEASDGEVEAEGEEEQEEIMSEDEPEEEVMEGEGIWLSFTAHIAFK